MNLITVSARLSLSCLVRCECTKDPQNYVPQFTLPSARVFLNECLKTGAQHCESARDHTRASLPDLEVISVKIGHILLCTVYITPNIDTGSLINLLSYLADLSSSSEHLLIVGDFNAPDIEWSSLTGTQSHSNLICDFVFHANFTQAVLEPTHTKGHILDIVLANCDLIQNLQVDTAHPVLSSDHYAITFDIDYYHKPVLKCKNQYV